MARVLILSSFVAASRVGGSAQALALARLGIEPILAPTALYGRHPGQGAPGGAAVSPQMFAGVLAGIEAQGRFDALDAVITGYFATAEQVDIAMRALERLGAASSAARVVVDPIMGDAGGGLYVAKSVAEAIASQLVPRADLVCPNAWELSYLTDIEVTDPAAALAAARRLGRPAVVSSVPCDHRIGVLVADGAQGWLATHARQAAAPKGTGDLLTAYVTAGLLGGRDVREWLAAAVGALADLVATCGADDPSIEALPSELAASPRVRVEALHG